MDVGTPASSCFRVFASLATPSAHVRRPLRRSACCYAPSLSASRAPGYSLCCAAPRSFDWRFRSPRCVLPHAARTQLVGESATALQSPHGTPPRLPNTKKGDGIPSPSGCQTATLPVQRPRFRASSYPTPWPLPLLAGRQSAQTACARLLPARQRHHAA